MLRSRFFIAAGLLWLLSLAGIVWLLLAVRANTVSALDSPEARQAWLKWKQDEAEHASSPSEPVRRKIPKSDEPPALLLLRDRFATLLAGALVTWSFFYGFTALIVHGMFFKRPTDKTVAT
ncbi:MAG: hypothetical protein AB7O62_18800 [Pirellulales bacterium]